MADEKKNLNQLIAEGTKDTGGRRDQVLATSGIPEALLRVADDLLNQYVVTYGRPERLIPPEKLQVTVNQTRRHRARAHQGGRPMRTLAAASTRGVGRLRWPRSAWPHSRASSARASSWFR